MFLNEVALGKEKHITTDDSSLVKAPPGFDCIVARGRTEPGTYIPCRFLLEIVLKKCKNSWPSLESSLKTF